MSIAAVLQHLYQAMKVLIATVLSAISIADGQVLRAAASRQRLMEDGERKTMQDMSMSMDFEHIVPTHTLEHIVPTYSPTEQDWQSYQLTPTSTLNYIIKSDALHAEVIYDGEAWLGVAVSEDGRMVGSEGSCFMYTYLFLCIQYIFIY